MSDTKFPFTEIADEFANETIENWFKRCMEEFPSSVAVDMRLQHTGGDYKSFYPYKKTNEWKEKWLGQFKECQHDTIVPPLAGKLFTSKPPQRITDSIPKESYDTLPRKEKSKYPEPISVEEF